MPKNKIGGKHKHLKNTVVNTKFKFLEISDDVSYAYVTKAYGNRTFDAVILKAEKCVRFTAQYKRRKARVGLGNLIKISNAPAFTKDFYVVEDLCGELETKAVEKSDLYKDQYRRARQEYGAATHDGDADVETLFDNDMINNEPIKRQSELVAMDLPDYESESDSDDIDDI